MSHARPAMQEALDAILGSQVAVLPAKPTSANLPPVDPVPYLGPRVADALALAIATHGPQARKGTSVPYLTHPLAVAALVGESGGDEEEVIAAILHDAVEDGGGLPLLKAIQDQFGARVADLVQGCTEEEGHGPEKAPWLTRKRAFLTHMVGAALPVLRIVCADKLHNARSLERDLREHGPSVFQRFKGDREGTLWYYRSLARLYGALVQDEPRLDHGFRTLIRDLRETVARLAG